MTLMGFFRYTAVMDILRIILPQTGGSLINFSPDLPAIVLNNIPKGDIEESKLHGMGLIANADIRWGEQLCELDGQIIPYSLITETDFPIDEWNALSGERVLYRSIRTKYSFINHSREFNLKVIGPDNLKDLVATKEITKGEELLLDYTSEPLFPAYISGHGASYLNQ